jgi:hypothetical protein
MNIVANVSWPDLFLLALVMLCISFLAWTYITPDDEP